MNFMSFEQVDLEISEHENGELPIISNFVQNGEIKKKNQNLLGLPSWDNGPTVEITCTTGSDPTDQALPG